MEKTAIIVNSKYGAAEVYGRWLAEETGGDLLPLSALRPRALEEYDNIIYCAGIYLSGIHRLGTLEKAMPALEGKKVAVFCVGASPFNPEGFRKLYRRFFDGDLKDVPAFYGRGRWDEEKMSFKDRSLCKLLGKSLKKKEHLTSWEKEFLQFHGEKRDWTDKAYLKPLLEWLKRDPFSPEGDEKMVTIDNF